MADNELAQEGNLPNEIDVDVDDNDGFSFDEWLSSSGLTVLKDILIKHKMTNMQSLSTESKEFAAFISDPMLLPRAMLIPQAIQSMQQLQQQHKSKQQTIKAVADEMQAMSSPSSEADIEKTKQDEIAKQQNDDDTKDEPQQTEPQQPPEGNNIAADSTDDENDNDNDNENANEEDADSKRERYKRSKKENKTTGNKGSGDSVLSFVSVDDDLGQVDLDKMNKPGVIKENTEKTEKKRRKMVKLKEGDHVKFVNSKHKEGIVRFIGETEFGDGMYYGVELTAGEGDCDGSVDDVVYFECDANNGIFAKRRALRRIAPTANKEKRSRRRSRADSMDSNASFASDISELDSGLKVTRKQKKKKKKKQKAAQHAKTERKAPANSSSSKDLHRVKTRQDYKTKLQKKKKKKNGRKARPVSLGAVDFSQMFNDRSSVKKKDDDYYKRARAELKKDGPRQIGKIKYKGIKDKKKKKKKKQRRNSNASAVSTDNDSEEDEEEEEDDADMSVGGELFGERLSHNTRKTAKKLKQVSSRDIVEPKLGPREIGKIKYHGLKLSKKEQEELEKSKFLDENLSHKTRKLRKNSTTSSQRGVFGEKLGPQEIGKIKYQGTKLTEAEKKELESKDVFEQRLHHKVKKKRKMHNRSKSLVGTKLGPLDMGKNHYKGTKLEKNEDDENVDILSEKTHHVIKKKWGLAGKYYQDDDDSDDDEQDYDEQDGDKTPNSQPAEDDEEEEEMVMVEYDENDKQKQVTDSDDDDDNALSLRPKRKKKQKPNIKVSTKLTATPIDDVPTKRSPRSSPRHSNNNDKPATPRSTNKKKHKKKKHAKQNKESISHSKQASQSAAQLQNTGRSPRSPTRSNRNLRLKNAKSSPTPSPDPGVSPISTKYETIKERKQTDSPTSPKKKKKKKKKHKKHHVEDSDEEEELEHVQEEKKKHKKKKKKKDKDKGVSKYKKKLKKQKSNPAPRPGSSRNYHYASESDHEYVESLRNNVNGFSAPPSDVEDDVGDENQNEYQGGIIHAEEEEQYIVNELQQHKHHQQQQQQEKFDFVERDDKKPKSKAPVLVQSHSTSPKQSSLIASSPKESTDDTHQHKTQEIAHFVHQMDHDTSESDSDVDDNNSLNALSSDDDDSPNEADDGGKQWI